MKTLAAIVAALAFTGTMQGATESESAWLTSTFATPVNCYTTAKAFNSSHAAMGFEIAGYVSYSLTLNEPVIDLAPATCLSLETTREGMYGNLESDAVFALSHELAHSTGADLAYEAAHTNEPVFQAQVAAIRAGFPTVDAPREAAADCVGLSKSSAVAYRLGMRGHQAFAELAKYAGTQGYVSIPADCRAS